MTRRCGLYRTYLLCPFQPSRHDDDSCLLHRPLGVCERVTTHSQEQRQAIIVVMEQ